MSTVIIVIVLISTFIHALWNFSIKKSKYPFEFLQLLAVGSGLIAFPVGIYFFISEKFSFYGTLLAIISGLIHVFYFYALGKAYEKGELSIVYPIARGTAVALVPIIGILVIGEKVGLTSIFGIIIVFIGIIVLGGKSLFVLTNKKNETILALFVGLTITFYTIIDKTYMVNYFEYYFIQKVLLFVDSHSIPQSISRFGLSHSYFRAFYYTYPYNSLVAEFSFYAHLNPFYLYIVLCPRMVT